MRFCYSSHLIMLICVSKLVMSLLNARGYQYQSSSLASLYARVEAVVWRRPSDAIPRSTTTYLEGHPLFSCAHFILDHAHDDKYL
jgi:hypothetical protein